MEAVVSRMKTVENALTRSARENKTDYTGIRFIAVSATVPNVKDVSTINWKTKSFTTRYRNVLICFINICVQCGEPSRPVDIE